MATAAKEKRSPGRPVETQALAQIGPDFVTQTPKDIQDAEAAWRNQQAVAQRNLAIVDSKFGDDLPYDLDRLITQARSHLQTSANSMFEAGRNLLQIKEHEDAGGFHRALERVGITPRAAQKMIQVAVKFGGRPALASLSTTKLMELVVEDDTTLDALEDGGSVADLKLDDIDKMTTRELAAALRKERQRRKDEDEANQRLLESKDQKLNQLEKTLNERQRRVKTWEGVVTEISSNLTIMTGGAVQQINHLRAQIEQIQDEANKFDLSKQEMEAIVKPFADHISTLRDYLDELQAEFGLNLSVYMPDFAGGLTEPLED